MHLDEERVERLLHGELPAPAEATAREHLSTCGECSGRVAEAEREENEVHALLTALDHVPPSIGAGTVAMAARARRRELGWGRWAAGLLLALGLAAGAYATPGSPLPGWVHAIADRIGGRPGPPREGADRPEAAEPGVAGIAVEPGREFVILFTSSQSEGLARVSLGDGAKVEVRAPIGAATFTSGVDRLVIDNRGSSASFEIQIPRVAPRVEIRVDGDRVFLKDVDVVATGGAMVGPGSYDLPLKSGGP